MRHFVISFDQEWQEFDWVMRLYFAKVKSVGLPRIIDRVVGFFDFIVRLPGYLLLLIIVVPFMIAIFLKRPDFKKPLPLITQLETALRVAFWLWPFRIRPKTTLRNFRLFDSRPLIFYLRGFETDSRLRNDICGRDALLETYVAVQAKAYGPIVSLGRTEQPADKMSSKAMRITTDDSNWKEVAKTVFENSRIVILMPDEGEGVSWEIEEIQRLGREDNTIVINPGLLDSVLPANNETQDNLEFPEGVFELTLEQLGASMDGIDPIERNIMCSIKKKDYVFHFCCGEPNHALIGAAARIAFWFAFQEEISSIDRIVDHLVEAGSEIIPLAEQDVDPNARPAASSNRYDNPTINPEV